ncbi:MAG: histidinol-phosphatase HisJ [Candidatus Odinarchaeota archaeon]
MNLIDYHTHCYLCNHAEGTLEEYIKAALICNHPLTEIGLSDHFPMHLLPEDFHIYAMAIEKFPDYIREAKKLRDKYQDLITVRISSEVDFHPDFFEEYRLAVQPFLDDIDYIIGSVHAVTVDGITIPIDAREAVPLIKEIGVDKAFLGYYDSVLKMVKSNFYQVVGHLDVPKKYSLIPENSEAVWGKVMQVLDAVEKTGIAVEINTSGMRMQVKEQYPGERIIKELIERNIPITLGSDAHRPQDVGYRFTETVNELKKWGLKTLCHFSKREKLIVPLH